MNRIKKLITATFLSSTTFISIMSAPCSAEDTLLPERHRECQCWDKWERNKDDRRGCECHCFDVENEQEAEDLNFQRYKCNEGAAVCPSNWCVFFRGFCESDPDPLEVEESSSCCPVTEFPAPECGDSSS